VSASEEQKKYGLSFKNISFEARCGCGYQQSLLSGNLSKETSLAPYFCDKCGLVDLNIREVPYKCPWCKSTDVKAYGSPLISLPSESEGAHPIIWNHHPAIWNDQYKVYKEGNLCPQCKKMTLMISKKYSDKVKPC